MPKHNKLLFAVTEQTAAEIIVSRADAEKANMALTAWKGSIVRKQDIFIAKNYLNKEEIDTLDRLVVIFLETAELRVKGRIDITMGFWTKNVDKIIDLNDKPMLLDKGSISNRTMEEKVRGTYALFDNTRKINAAIQEDKQDLEDLKALEKKVKRIK